MDILLPPLDIQRAIVQKWEEAQAEIQETEREIESLEKSVINFIQMELGTVRRNSDSAKYFAIRWSGIDRWGVDMTQRFMIGEPIARYPIVQIKSVCKIGSGGTPSRKVSAYYNPGTIPWVKTSEVVNDVIYETEERISELGLMNSSAKVYPVGSIIVAMYGQGATRGRTGKLGIEAATNQACCVLFDIVSTTDPDFLWFYLISEYGRLRQLASGNNQPNLNAEMIATYPFVQPPIDVQVNIVSIVREIKRKIAEHTRRRDLLKLKTDSDIEAFIVGKAP